MSPVKPYQKEEAVDTKPEPKPVPEPKQNPATLIAANPSDVYIAQLAASQPETLLEAEAREIFVGDGDHRLTLPKEVKEIFARKNYAPRWISKDKRMLDRAVKQRGWNLVTRVYFPDLPDELFSATGVIENGDAILGFMPERKATKLRTEPGQKSAERVKNLPIEKWKDDPSGERYYKPKLSNEKDGETLNEGLQP